MSRLIHHGEENPEIKKSDVLSTVTLSSPISSKVRRITNFHAMKSPFILLLAFLLSLSPARAATLEQFFPWLSPNPLAFGTSFDDFKKLRPVSVDISVKALKSGEPFEGGLIEQMPDGSVFAYSFFDDKLVAASWAAPASPETSRLLLAVRNSLLHTCGEPTLATTGRVKGTAVSRGSSGNSIDHVSTRITGSH